MSEYKNYNDIEPIMGYYEGCNYKVWSEDGFNGWVGEVALKQAFEEKNNEGFVTIPHLILYKEDFSGWVNENGYVTEAK
jgi:hypothetical protein